MQFTFPLQQITSLQSIQVAKATITAMLQQQHLFGYCRYKFRMIKGIYIYCMCCECSARLVYKKEEEKFVLIKAITKHQHKKIKSSKLAVIQAIQNFPSCFNKQTIKEEVMKRFSISEPTFYRRLRQSQSFGKNLKDVLTALEAEGIFGVTIQGDNQEFPSLLLLTSELMIQNYHRNGKNVKFDLTYNIIRQRTSNQQQYAVGVFLSLNRNLNIEPHCLVVMADESKISFQRAFTEFFSLMKSAPHIITTDQQKNMKLALQSLRQRGLFTGHHLIDVFHVLRNTKKALFNKQAINYFTSLSRSSHTLEYRYRRRLCLEKISERDKEILNKFDEKMERCCIALIPPTFVGLSCTTSCSQKMNDILKNKLPYSINYLSAVGKLAKLLSQRACRPRQFTIQKVRLEEFTTIQEIEQLRMSLCKRVFRKLMLELSISSTCLINMTEEPHCFEVIEQDFEEAHFFVESDAQGIWKCQCKLSEKIGLPCSHIIKVLLLLKQKIRSSINSWWLLNPEERTESKVLNRPRKTRRYK